MLSPVWDALTYHTL